MAEGYWGKYWRRRVSRRRVLAGGAAVGAGAAALVAVGCGDDDDDDDAAPAAATQAAQATEAAAEATEAAAAAGEAEATEAAAAAEAEATEAPSAIQRGGTFRHQKSSQNTSLDPSVTVTDPTWTALTYNHLLGYSLVEEEAWGDAATGWEQPDATTLVFSLEEGLKFNPEVAGGRDMTSEDVAFSYGRFPSSLAELGSEVNQLQWGWMGVDRGASFDTPDATTLAINLAFPWASAIPSLGSSAMAIVAREAVEAGGGHLKDTPNAGGGAYMFDAINDTGNTYKRNPNYRGHSGDRGRFTAEMPYIDRWEDAIVTDLSAREARLLAGDSDVLGGVDKIQAELFAGESNVQIIEGPANDHAIMELDGFKWAQHPLLREALSLSIDWEAYIDVVLDGEGIRGAPVGPAFSQVLPQDEIRELQQFDPARAKALWAQGGGDEVFPDGFVTVIATFGTSTRHIEFIAQSIEENLGVPTRLEPADLANYVALATAPAGQKIWHYFIAGENSLSTIPDYNALTHYVPNGYGAIFGGVYTFDHPLSAAYPEEIIEVTNEIGTELQGRYDLQGATVDPEERKQVLQDLQRYIFTNFCCVLPLPVPSVQYYAMGARLRNVPGVPDIANNASMGYRRAQNMWIEA